MSFSLVGGSIMKKEIPTFNIQLTDMFNDRKNPKKHQEKFKRWLLDKTEREEREANIQRVDAQTKKYWGKK